MAHKKYPETVSDAMHTLAVQRARVAPSPLDKSILDLLERSSGYSPEEWLRSMLKSFDKRRKS